MDSPAPRPADKARPSILVGRSLVYPSSTNPRTRFDEASLKELAASMAPPVGIIEPLIVRPHPTKGEGRYEVVAGERRWKAAGLAGIDEIPIIVRELDDTQVLDLQLIENKHRDDIHPLEEARAMERRIKLDRQLTPKGMAKFIGVSERYVQNRLRYLTLIGEAQKMFLDGEILSAHADLLIRLPPDSQRRALKEGLYIEAWEGDKRVKELSSARSFDDWLKRNMRLTPAEMMQTGLFPEVDAVVNADVPVSTLVELVDSYYYEPKKGESTLVKPITNDRWEEVKPTDKCDYQQRGVLVLGHRQGRILTVCTGYGKCKKHFAESIKTAAAPRSTGSNGSSPRPAPKKKSAADIAFEKRQQESRAEEKAWNTARKPILALLEKAAVKVTPTPKLIRFVSQQAGFGGNITTFGELVKGSLGDIYYIGDAQDAAKALGVDLKPLLAPKAKPAKKAIAKKPTKKTAGGRKKK